MSRALRTALFVCLVWPCVGCGGGQTSFESAKKPQAAGAPNAADGAIPQQERKIIATVKMTLSVENLDNARPKLEELIKSGNGFVASSDESGSVGSFREGRWTIRVPVKSMDNFVSQVSALGEVARKTSEAKDVTDEFVDTTARLKHWKTEEDTLLRLMKEKAQSTEDIIKFRSQLASIRENIDRLEARMNTLTRLTEMSTLELTMTERKVYSTEQTPTYTTKLGRAFGDSVTVIVDFFEWVGLAIVAIAPWLPFLILGQYVVRRLFRKFFVNTSKPKPVVAKPA